MRAKAASSAKTFDQVPKTYAGLAAWHMPRPLRDKAEYENAVEIVDQLAGHDLNADQDDYLDLLSDLVAAYEDEHVKPLRKIGGVEALKYILKENAQTGDDLAALLKVERSVAYRILKGTRNLTADHIRVLAKRFQVSADLFLA
jgi:HTH-type transcriptional regulator / antitoxin HigA